MSYASPFQLALFGPDLRPPPVTGERIVPAPQLEDRARTLALSLSRTLHAPIRLAVTDNRTSMVSFQRGPTGLRLRLHHMFLDAPPAIVEALAAYVGQGSPEGSATIDAYIHGQQERIRSFRTSASPELNPRGQWVDLQAVLTQLNAQFFEGKIAARIGWGRAPARRRRKSIRLGVYDHPMREIRIHPSLDHPTVPRYFIEFIVFHEMLHQVFPSTVSDRRKVHHPRVFRERERTFPRYREALQWERENLRALLRLSPSRPHPRQP